jgi:histidinol-phosphate aminotransferase
MSDLAAPHILALTAYEPGKPEEELKRELGIDDVVKLASNENPYGPSPRAIEAVSGGSLALHRYPDPRGHDLREALAAHHGVPAAELCLGNGSNELIDLICRTTASRGEHAVFGHPSFPCYRIGSVAQELSFAAVPLRDHLHWNVDDLLDAVTAETKLLFVSNPNNPTGSYIAKGELERLLRSLPERVLSSTRRMSSTRTPRTSAPPPSSATRATAWPSCGPSQRRTGSRRCESATCWAPQSSSTPSTVCAPRST